MRKKAIMIVNTVFQLIVVVQMKMTVLKEMDVDLLITDYSVGMEKYIETGKKAGIFAHIQYAKNLTYFKRIGEYEKVDIISEMKYSFGRYGKILKENKFLKPYHYIFTGNMDGYAMALYDVVKLFYNKNVHICMFEDGLSTYKNAEVSINNRIRDAVNGDYKHIYRITRYGQAFDAMKDVFLFNPELFSWKRKKDIRVHKIPKIQKNDYATIKMLNTFFGYKTNEDMFRGKKVIFFEESFYGDGYSVNDTKLVKDIADCVGNDKVLVKLHPRNREKNRFENYDIYENQSVPWEIVYLNHDFSDIELVSISSGSIMHPFVVFGDKKRMVVLQKLANLSIATSLKIYQKFLKEKIYEPNPDVYFMPENEDQLKEYFTKVGKKDESSCVDTNKIK